MKSFGTRHPTVFEINTWVWLAELGLAEGRAVTLASVPQREIERVASHGFDAVWLMGVWERSPAARAVSRSNSGWLHEYRQLLPDLEERDIVGSPYAVRGYNVEPSFGGDEALQSLRRRFAEAGMKLVLDFVPNHVALDHPWLASHPGRILQGTEEQIAREPQNYFRSEADRAGRVFAPARVFAHGRDPYFDGWPDTAQLDYRRRETRDAMTAELLSIAEKCDGARCDMAMLLTREVFLRTWGGEFDEETAEFWPAAVAEVKRRFPEFVLLAEVYWDMEYELQRQGFDYTYDKRLYDRLRDGDAPAVNGHLRAALDFQERLVRFVENHDEPRAAEAFEGPRGLAASTLTLTLPGLRLLHEGQLEGRRRKLSVHLGRRPEEDVDGRLAGHYRRLLAALRHEVFHAGGWRLLEAREAGDGSFRDFAASLWESGDERRLVVANLSHERARCHLPLGAEALGGRDWFLTDLLSEARYLRGGDSLLRPGLYLDLPGHGCHLFEITPG